MSDAGTLTAYKSPLFEMTQTTPTCLWNDSASIQELTYSIEHGGIGATCNPVIVLGVLKKEMPAWQPRIQQLIAEMPTATEDQIGWKLVEEISIKAAALLKPIFDAQDGEMAGSPSRPIRDCIETRRPSWRRPCIQPPGAEYDREDSGHARRHCGD